MTADQYIDLAIEKGILYRREKLGGNITRITFTKLYPTGDGKITMNERHVSATNGNEAEAAEDAYLGITEIR